jgi:hypothetical protein
MEYYRIPKWGLAHLYGITVATLMRDIKEIQAELIDMGYKTNNKCFTPRQMERIVKYLGQPNKKQAPTLRPGLA